MLTKGQDTFSTLTVHAGGFNCRQNCTNNWVIQTLHCINSKIHSCMKESRLEEFIFLLKYVKFLPLNGNLFVGLNICTIHKNASYSIYQNIAITSKSVFILVHSNQCDIVMLSCTQIYYVHLFASKCTAKEISMSFGHSCHLGKFQLTGALLAFVLFSLLDTQTQTTKI